MSEHVNKPDVGLKTQEEIMLKVSSTHGSESDLALEKSNEREAEISEKAEAENSEKSGIENYSSNPAERKQENSAGNLNDQSGVFTSQRKTGSDFEKISSKGVKRHQRIIAGCALLSVCLLGLSTFDCSYLISKPVIINKNHEVTMVKEKADLSPSLNYVETRFVEPDPVSKLTMVMKSSWKGRAYGYVDSNGKTVIKPQFRFARPFSEGLAVVQVGDEKEQKWGYIDPTGRFKIPAKYDRADLFHKGLAIVGNNRETGLIDKSGKEIIKTEYSFINSWGDNYIVGNMRNKVGIMNRQGKWIVQPIYSGFSGIAHSEPTYMMSLLSGAYQGGLDVDADYLKICKNDAFGIMSKDGSIVIPLRYDEIINFRNGIAAVKLNGRIGFVDTKGNVVIPPQYDNATAFDDLIAVQTGKKWHFIDKLGKPVPTVPIDRIVNDLSGQWFADGLGPIIKDGKVGYLNAKGTLAIAPQFEVGIPFNNGSAAVLSSDRWRFIDTSGKFIPGYVFGSLRQSIKGQYSADIPGMLYPFVRASHIKSMRTDVSKWIAGESPYRYLGGFSQFWSD